MPQVQKKDICKIRYKNKAFEGKHIPRLLPLWKNSPMVMQSPQTQHSHMANPSQRVCNFHLQNKHPKPGPRSDNGEGMLASYLQMVGCSSQSYPNQKVLTAMQLESPLAVIEKNCGCLGSPPAAAGPGPLWWWRIGHGFSAPPIVGGDFKMTGFSAPQGTRWIRWERH
jgi:hypothetical protein